jgi:flagellar biosynthesis/type III secretory pathway protein FliH
VGSPSDTQRPGTGRIIDGAVFDARVEADAVRRAAHDEVSGLRAQAAVELAALKESARQEGLEEGRAQAAAEVLALTTEARRLRERAASELAPLAVDIARRILGEGFKASPELVASAVAGAVAGCGPRAIVAVRVNPADRPRLLQRLPDLAAADARLQGIDVVADAAVAPGGCLIEMKSGTLDARLEVQLASFERALRGVLP